MTNNEAIERLKVLTDYEYYEDLEALDMAIKALEQKEKIGKWIRGGYDDMYYVCSECDYKATEYWIKPKYNYCPNCGAKMVEPQESEDKE